MESGQNRGATASRQSESAEFVPKSKDLRFRVRRLHFGDTHHPECCLPSFVGIPVSRSIWRAHPEAAAEFQKILDHRGVVSNEPIAALAYLGLARAYGLQAASAHGDEGAPPRAKARAAYQDFLALWKEADPAIPVLKQARTEYAKLR